MGIEGYLVRIDAATVAEIRTQAREKKYELLELETEKARNREWLDQDVINKPLAEDDEDDADQPDEQYFPTACYEWFPPCDSPSGDVALIMTRFLALGEKQTTFMYRVCIYRFILLFPREGLDAISALQANRAWKLVIEKDKSLSSGLMQDLAPTELVRMAVGLQLLQEVGSAATAEDRVYSQTERAEQLIRDVRLHGDNPFFWEEEWTPGAAGGNKPSPPGSSVAGGVGLLGLPRRALMRVLLRLDSGRLSMMESVSKRSRGMLLLPREQGAAPPGNSDELLTPLGRVAWFVCHRRGHGDCHATGSLEKLGYRADCIRRDRREHVVQQHLRGVGGMRLGGEWHMLAHGLGKDVCLICVGGGDTKEREIGYEMGGSGIPVLVHSPEEVARAHLAMRARYHSDVCCLCSDSEAFPHRPGMTEEDHCQYHAPFVWQSSWDFASECQKAGVLCPRYADDIDVAWRFRVLMWFVEATCKNGQGLLCYVW